MNICLVTGACGFIGRHMIDLLLEEGHTVVATDIKKPQPGQIPDGVQFLQADLSSPDDVAPLFEEGIEWVFHPAAVFDYSASWNVLKNANIDAMEVLCEQAIKAGVKRFVCWSTMGVYGPPEKTKGLSDETHPKRPGNDYERSKWEQEKVGMRCFQSDRLPIVVIRPAPVYGSNSVYGFADMLIKMAPFPIVPVPVNLKNRIICVHVRDVVGAALHLAEADASCLGEAYNVLDDSVITQAQMAKLIARLMGKPTIPTFVPVQLLKAGGRIAADISEFLAKNITKGRPLVEKPIVDYVANDYRFTNKKLKATGYEFKYPDCRVGIEETIRWFQENRII